MVEYIFGPKNCARTVHQKHRVLHHAKNSRFHKTRGRGRGRGHTHVQQYHKGKPRHAQEVEYSSLGAESELSNIRWVC